MNAGAPLVSVVLPVRGEAPFLRAALRSLRWQTCRRHETLLVDDGLRRERRRWLDSWRRSYPALRVLSNKGDGLVDALNTGMRAARSPWVARMDADDLCHPWRLELQLAALAAEPVDVLGCEVRAFPGRQVTSRWRQYERWQNSLHSPAEHRRDAFVESPLCHPSVVMRRQAVLDMGAYRHGDFAEDYDLWLRLLGAGARLAKLDRALLLWREQGDRLTRRDPRYRPDAFRRLKAEHLARPFDLASRPFWIWGAGKEGKALGRALASLDLRPRGYIDIDPRKIGGRIAGVPVVGFAQSSGTNQVWQQSPNPLLLIAVGTAGVRETLRAELLGLNLVELRDFVFMV